MPNSKSGAFFVILKDRMKNRELLSVGFELAYIIALPVIGFSLAGKWLDGRFGTMPLFTMIGIVLAIVSTTIWIYRSFRDKMK